MKLSTVVIALTISLMILSIITLVKTFSLIELVNKPQPPRFELNQNLWKRLGVNPNNRTHGDDFKNGNAYYFQELNVSPYLNFYGRSWAIRDTLGWRIVTEYDVLFIMRQNEGTYYLDYPPPGRSKLIDLGIKFPKGYYWHH